MIGASWVDHLTTCEIGYRSEKNMCSGKLYLRYLSTYGILKENLHMSGSYYLGYHQSIQVVFARLLHLVFEIVLNRWRRDCPIHK